MTENSGTFNEFISKFNSYSKNIDSFLKKDEKSGSEFVDITKSLYDFTKLNSKRLKCVADVNTNALNELHLKGFGLEEIWNQINLDNQPILDDFLGKVASLCTQKQIRLGLVANANQVSKSSSVESKNATEPLTCLPKVMTTTIEIAQDSDNNEEDEFTSRLINQSMNSVKKGSVVDDKFFKLSEMEEFLKREDLKDERERSGKEIEEEDDIDLFANVSDSEVDGSADTLDINELNGENKKSKNAREATYNDFFDTPVDENHSMTVNYDNDNVELEEEDDDEEEEVNEDDKEEIDYDDVDDNTDLNAIDKSTDANRMSVVSSDEESEGETVQQILGKGSDSRGRNQSKFEIEQSKLKQKISKLERENISEKPWQLKGEISADKRPENSLLEEHLQFDYTSKQAPLITEETTQKLEDIIKQRIKDTVWDDVERKQKPVEKPFEYKQRLLIDQDKGKVSLAKVYEEEYLRKQKDEKVEEENPEHKEIKQLMKKLFAQLDALSNFSYTPKPPESEVKIINNLPAVMVEEVTPAIVSDAALLAPEEVAGKVRGDIKADTERDATDKKRERRHKKKFQKLKHKQQLIKEKTQTGNKYNKTQALQLLKEAKKGNLSLDSNKEGAKALKSSKSFFAKLNDEIHTESKKQKTKSKPKTNEISSKRLKL